MRDQKRNPRHCFEYYIIILIHRACTCSKRIPSNPHPSSKIVWKEILQSLLGIFNNISAQHLIYLSTTYCSYNSIFWKFNFLRNVAKFSRLFVLFPFVFSVFEWKYGKRGKSASNTRRNSENILTWCVNFTPETQNKYSSRIYLFSHILWLGEWTLSWFLSNLKIFIRRRHVCEMRNSKDYGIWKPVE